MNRIIRILMKRDGMGLSEATDLYNDVRDEIEELIQEDGSLIEAEEIIMDNFGLEADYLEDILYDLEGLE